MQNSLTAGRCFKREERVVEEMGRGFSSDRARSLVRVGSRSTADLAAEARKKGVDVLRVEAAPVLQLPPHVTEAASKAAREKLGYAPSRGLPELRKAISEKLRAENDIEANPDTEILVTNGGNHGLTLAIMSAIDPGDEVIVPSPCYFFSGFINLASGVPVYVPMPEKEGFPLRADIIEKKVTPRTKALIVNTPVNPTGHVAKRGELAEKDHNHPELHEELRDACLADWLYRRACQYHRAAPEASRVDGPQLQLCQPEGSSRGPHGAARLGEEHLQALRAAKRLCLFWIQQD